MHQQLYEKIVGVLQAAHHSLPPTDEATDTTQLLDALLDELQPFDLALVLQNLTDDEQLALLREVPPATAAETLGHFDHDEQYRLLDDIEREMAQAILAEMPSDNLVDLLGAVHPLRAQVLLERLSADQQGQIRQLMTYPENTAGGLMTVSYLSARATWTVDRAMAHFRKVGRDVEITSYIYVVDGKGRLAGVASMRDIFLSPADTSLSDIMFTKIVTINAKAKQEDAATLLEQYDFLALPVVDDAERLVGVIAVDDIMDVVQEEATEDIQRLGGSQPLEEPYLQANIFSLFRSRVGWLLVLFVAESLTGTIMRSYEDVLQQVVALAFFIPLLIDTGGNTGSQASTLVIRAMALGEVTMRDFLRVIWREARVSILLGTVMALMAYVRAMMLGGPMALGLTVGLTICLIVILGSTIGAALPLIGKRFGLDPAVFSAPLITTIADGVGLLIYFRVAVWLLGIGV